MILSLLLFSTYVRVDNEKIKTKGDEVHVSWVKSKDKRLQVMHI